MKKNQNQLDEQRLLKVLGNAEEKYVEESGRYAKESGAYMDEFSAYKEEGEVMKENREYMKEAGERKIAGFAGRKVLAIKGLAVAACICMISILTIHSIAPKQASGGKSEDAGFTGAKSNGQRSEDEKMLNNGQSAEDEKTLNNGQRSKDEKILNNRQSAEELQAKIHALDTMAGDAIGWMVIDDVLYWQYDTNIDLDSIDIGAYLGRGDEFTGNYHDPSCQADVYRVENRPDLLYLKLENGADIFLMEKDWESLD